MGFIDSLQSKKGKKFMGYLYGWGAAVVIIGAMFKIQHWPGASPMLVAGLSIEAIIFFFSAFEPIHEETDWSLVYPELAHGHDDEEGHGHDDKKKKSGTLTQELDKMLEEAKIGPELIQSLGSGMQSLSDQAGKLTNIADASVATNEYVSNVKNASKSVGDLTSSYVKASESLTALAGSAQDGRDYSDQLSLVSKNLSALNAVYELQLKGSNDQLKNTNKFYEGISELMTNLHESVEDTKKYKEQISSLSQNLEALNTVYGNMLSAMNFKK